MLIIEKCMKYADRLYEKFSQNVNRKTQSSAWNDVANELKDEGIIISDTHKLRQNVSNWVHRATVSKPKYIFGFYISFVFIK